jgi:hypothetical protein
MKNESPNGETGSRRRTSVIKTKMPHKHAAEITIRELLQCITCLTLRGHRYYKHLQASRYRAYQLHRCVLPACELSFILTQVAKLAERQTPIK